MRTAYANCSYELTVEQRLAPRMLTVCMLTVCMLAVCMLTVKQRLAPRMVRKRLVVLEMQRGLQYHADRQFA